MTVPPLDDWALALAGVTAQKSKDPNTQVGCVILRPDKSVCSVGYNGFPRGMEDRPEWYEDRAEKLDRVVHAEMNALLSSYEPVRGMTVYVTHPPCLQCAKLLAAAGVARVVFNHPSGAFLERWGEELKRAQRVLADSGVLVESVKVEVPLPTPVVDRPSFFSSTLLKAKRLAEDVGMYESLHITSSWTKTKYYLSRRTFAGPEVDWTTEFEVSREEAEAIVELGYATWWERILGEMR